MRALYWVLLIGFLSGSFFYFKEELHRQTFKAFLNDKEIQVLPNGETIMLEKTEVFILSDDTIYMFKEGCETYLEYFREQPQNIPRSVLKRCLVE